MLGEHIAIFDEFRTDLDHVNRPLRYRPRTNRQAYELQAPLTPWYFDPESGGRNPAPEDRKLGIRYED